MELTITALGGELLGVVVDDCVVDDVCVVDGVCVVDVMNVSVGWLVIGHCAVVVPKIDSRV